MTRALTALLEGFWMPSLYWHPMLIPTALSAAAALAAWKKGNKGLVRKILLVWSLCMILVWILRLLFFFPGEYGWFGQGLIGRILERLL